MTTSAIEIQGTLREDGTLLLDQKLNLPPGRVKVTVRAIPDYRQTDLWQFFGKIKAEREALGMAPRQEEIDNYLATMRDDDERCQLIEKSREECRPHREQRETE